MSTVNRSASSAQNEQPLVLELREEIERRVRCTWPDFTSDLGAFVARVADLSGSMYERTHVISGISIEDLYLAYACGRQEPKALRTFASMYDPDLRAVGAKFGLSEADVDDVRQSLWDKLFVSVNGVPGRIAEYKGEGRLRYWFRAVATRMFVDRARELQSFGRAVHPLDLDNLHHCAVEREPELAAIRVRYSEQFRHAFESAVASLDPDERNAIRCYYLLGMTADQMSVVLGAHRATAARRVSRAREKLLAATRDRLKQRLGADSNEIDSILQLFKEGLSITLSRILR